MMFLNPQKEILESYKLTGDRSVEIFWSVMELEEEEIISSFKENTLRNLMMTKCQVYLQNEIDFLVNLIDMVVSMVLNADTFISCQDKRYGLKYTFERLN